MIALEDSGKIDGKKSDLATYLGVENWRQPGMGKSERKILRPKKNGWGDKSKLLVCFSLKGTGIKDVDIDQ